MYMFLRNGLTEKGEGGGGAAGSSSPHQIDFPELETQLQNQT